MTEKRDPKHFSNNPSDLLYRLVSYARDYINLVNPATSRYKIYTDYLPQKVINLSSLFSPDDEEFTSPIVKVSLDTFYKFTPKELMSLDEETKKVYEDEKKTALKLEEIAGKFKINEYTKQVVLNFGFFTAEYLEEPKTDEEGEATTIDGGDEVVLAEPKYKKQTNPLFSIPIQITQNSNGVYEINLLDDRVTTNFGFLVSILLDKNYFEFIAYLNEMETENKLTLPINPEVLLQIWDKLKTCLRLSKAIFDDESFSMDFCVVSLSAKSNYFLAQDLTKLLSLKDADLLSTSLASWIPGLNDIEKLPEDSNALKEVFFPFDYNKYQKSILKQLPYKASIVEGPPGTGKSQTIANLLCHLAANNKKVLFLSQKPQALKVVKDKLKDLDIKYLFGYIPDRYSSIYSDQEEADSAGSLLAGVSEYLNTQSYDNSVNLRSKPEEPVTFDEYINAERKFTELIVKNVDLAKYDLGIIDFNKFTNYFNITRYGDLVNIESQIEGHKQYCSEILIRYSDLSQLDLTFKLIDFNNCYTTRLEKIIDEISKSYYDRNNKLGRLILNKVALGYKIRNYKKSLPGEIVDYLEKACGKEVYKSEVLAELNKLKNFFSYKESIIAIDKLSNDLKLLLNQCGLTVNSFNMIKELASKEPLLEVVNKTLDLYKVRDELKNLKLKNPNLINKNLTEVRQMEKLQIKNYIKNRVKKHVESAFAGQTVKSTIAKIARSLKKSKRAYKTFDTLKGEPSNFVTVSDLVPVWIMSLEDASRLVPLIQELFDYVILDEASQCNLAYAIPAMFRTKHILFFGDSEQMRDDSIKFKSNRALLSIAEKNRIPDTLQIKGEGDSVKSVLDIGYLAGFEKSALLNHYRSPREIIGFSNDYFYSPKGKNLNVLNSNYLTYKDTNRLLVVHKVDTDKSDDESSKSNLQEALYIKYLINDLKTDPKTKDKTIGVLTFFNEQALLLKNTIDDPDIKVAIIEGIQGDEKDIIIFSFVISDPSQKKKYIPLTSEGGDINKSINEGRVNVAFSRARMQVHCVTSLETDRWPEGIWIKKYLQYAEKNGLVDFNKQELLPFDSLFEEEFYYFIRSELGKEYIVQNQVQSCGFKIDFVVTNTRTNQRLAIECDGPTHFEDEGSEIYVISDLERQAILESAGWAFYRVPYSKWILEGKNKSQFSAEIREIFNEEPAISTVKVVKKPSIAKIEFVQKEKIPAKPAEKNISKKEDEESQDEVLSEASETNSDFHELFKFEIDNQHTLVVSEVSVKERIWINEFVSRGNYTGFTEHGVGFMYSDTKQFITNARETTRTGRETRMPWKTGTHSELVITKIASAVYKGKYIIDLRQYITTTRYTGYTRKGVRLFEDEFRRFVSLLEEKVSL